MTTFSDEQKKLLAADLLKSNVKSREQSGRKLSFIEGWFAIAEANRIFGFDGWSSETLEVKCVSEKAREIGANKAPGFGVTYIAKCRITIGFSDTLVREGCGTGHGIDRDLGQAHESAIKEAETDARKRALMTFGNQFGLALYDKTQENVTDDTNTRAAVDAQNAPADARRAAGMAAAKKGTKALTEWGKTLSTKERHDMDTYINLTLWKTARLEDDRKKEREEYGMAEQQ